MPVENLYKIIKTCNIPAGFHGDVHVQKKQDLCSRPENSDGIRRNKNSG